MEDSSVPQVVEKLVADIEKMFEGDTRDVALKTVAFIGGLLAHHSYYISKLPELKPLTKMLTDILVAVSMDIQTLKKEHPYQLEALVILNEKCSSAAGYLKDVRINKQLFNLTCADVLALDSMIGMIYFDKLDFEKQGYAFVPQLTEEFSSKSLFGTEYKLVSLLDTAIVNNIFNETNEISTFQIMHMCAVSTDRYFKTVGKVIPHFDDPDVLCSMNIASETDRKKELANLFGLKQLGKYF